MLILKNRSELRAWRDMVSPADRVVFVPTMGALHLGHRSLLRTAAANGEKLLVSIFVNPTQFERSEDLQIYPRSLEADLVLLQDVGAAAVYVPDVADMYDSVSQVSIDPGPVANCFEGAARPGHFAGMLTVVHKLLQRCRPQMAFFGEKDAQQLFLVSRMVQDLDMPVQIYAAETFREDDGLAYSSRNVQLDAAARQEALALHRSLHAAQQSFAHGQHDPRQLESLMRDCFKNSPADLAYAAVVSERNFEAAQKGGTGPWRAIVAARLNGVHLLDNLALGDPTV